MPKIKPIPFSGPMVLAIQNTRYHTWPPDPIDPTKPCKGVTRRIVPERLLEMFPYKSENDILEAIAKHPKYQPSDVCYVAEGIKHGYKWEAEYAADGANVGLYHWGWKVKTLPSIFMPKVHAREWVEITDVRPEMVGDVTDQEAIYEGFRDRQDFLEYFWSLGKRKRDDRTWVWRYQFERVEQPEGWGE